MRGAALKKACHSMIEEMRGRYTLGSLKVKLSGVRKLMPADHEALSYLKLTDADYEQLRAGWQGKTFSDMSNRKPISAKLMTATATALLSGDSHFDIAAGLLFLTGRRPFEIFVTGDFAPIRGHGDTSKSPQVEFSGQSKTRGAEGTKSHPYAIPVLTRPSKVIAAFHRLRALCPTDPNMTQSQYDSKYHTRVSSYSELHFGQGFTPRSLRSAYAAVCYHRYAPKNVHDLIYFADILGHRILEPSEAVKSKGPDLATAAAYADFRVDEVDAARIRQR